MSKEKEIIVNTTGGTVRGVWQHGVSEFRGIPFAEPPIGSLRFLSPRPPKPWTYIRDCTTFSPASYQMNSQNLEEIKILTESIGLSVPGVIAGPESVFHTYNHDIVAEDCLYLNIWAPHNDVPRSDLPVMLYFHGGANMVSSGAFDLERGTMLAREEQIIVVRPNYRLGALGWVHFGLVNSEMSEAVNLGVQDQVAALKWIHENIASFGGDPGNITIAGESAGATAVSHLLNYEPAHQYFRRAIIQSLSPFNPWCTQQRPEAEWVARKYMELLQVSDVESLRDIHPSRFIAVQNLMAKYVAPDQHLAWRPLGAVVDSKWVPRLPLETLSTQDLKKPKLEVMIGVAKDEWNFFRGHTQLISDGNEDEVLSFLSQAIGVDAARVVYARFQKLHGYDSPGKQLSDIMSFEFFKLPSLAIAINLSERRIPVYFFQFSYKLPGLQGRLGAVHTGDMPFLFRNYGWSELSRWPFFEDVSEKDIKRHAKLIENVSREMGSLYVGFIKSGVPGPRWEAFNRTDWSILNFGHDIGTKHSLLKGEYETFKEIGLDSITKLEEVLTNRTRYLLEPEVSTKIE